MNAVGTTSSTSAGVTIHLKDRALSATAEGITIADARLPGRPIVYANAGFERLTGYSSDDVVGRNCRFLQGPDTDEGAVAKIRDSLDANKDCTVEILNYRKDGKPFWNRLSITPVRDSLGDVTHFIGVQSDVSERRRAEDELKTALDELQRDLELAARMQQSMLPNPALSLKGAEVAWEFRPCTQLAGDFLNVFPLDDRHIGVYVLDVSGHGASAALLSVTLGRWLSPSPDQSCLFEDGSITSPARVAEHLNARFQSDLRSSQYFTMVYGVFDVETRIFRYVAAGHPGPVFVPRKGESTFFDSTAPPLGLIEHTEFEENVLSLAPGDRLYFYTDGLTEASNAKDEELGPKRLVEALAECREAPLERTLGRALTLVDGWQGAGRRDDDISILGFETGE